MGSSPDGAASDGAGDSPSGGQPNGSAGANGRPSSAPSAVAIPDGPVKIGIFTAKGTASFGNSAGAGSQYFSSFDQQKHARALIADINKRGGLDGHRLDPVFAALDLTGSDSYAQQEQAACEAFTVDNRVLAVLTLYIGFYAGLDNCLSKRGVPMIESDQFVRDNAWYAAAPGMRFTIESPRWDAAVDALVSSLVRNKQLTRSKATGILAYDTPTHRAQIERIWKPALSRFGLAAPEVAYLHYPSSTADLGSTTAQLQSTVLRWKAANIEVVLDNGKAAYTFNQVADSQGYHPFYGLTSYSQPAVFNGTNNVAAAGVGWTPYLDTSADPPSIPAYKRCMSLTIASGTLDWSSDAAGRNQALVACDAFAVLEAVAKFNGALTRAGLGPAIRQLGTSMQSAQSLGMRFDTTHADGVTGYREFSYNNGCRCMGYTSPVKAL